METALKIEGIYDTRTLKFLKSKSVKNFGFDFSPKSFNFVQEHVFLEQLVPLLDTNDKLTLSFARSNDPMIQKVLFDLKKTGFSVANASIVCYEWPVSPKELNVGYYLYFSPDLPLDQIQSENFKGFIFSFSFFSDLHEKKLLTTFISNFYTRYGKLLDGKESQLHVGWKDNLFPSLLDIFDFDQLIFSINNEIETCYRNVDLKRLESELTLMSSKNSSALDKDF